MKGICLPNTLPTEIRQTRAFCTRGCVNRNPLHSLSGEGYGYWYLHFSELLKEGERSPWSQKNLGAFSSQTASYLFPLRQIHYCKFVPKMIPALHLFGQRWISFYFPCPTSYSPPIRKAWKAYIYSKLLPFFLFNVAAQGKAVIKFRKFSLLIYLLFCLFGFELPYLYITEFCITELSSYVGFKKIKERKNITRICRFGSLV